MPTANTTNWQMTQQKTTDTVFSYHD